MCEDLSKDAAQAPCTGADERGCGNVVNRGGRGPVPGRPAAGLLAAGASAAAARDKHARGVRGRNVWHRPVNAVKRLASATGEGAIAIQFQHEYLKPLGSGRHPPTSRRINRGLPPVVLHAGQAPGLRRQVPDTVLVTNSASGGGPGMSHGMPAPGDPLTNVAASPACRPPVSSARCGP